MMHLVLLWILGYFVTGFVVATLSDAFEARYGSLGIIISDSHYVLVTIMWPIVLFWLCVGVILTAFKATGISFGNYRKFVRGELRRSKKKGDIIA